LELQSVQSIADLPVKEEDFDEIRSQTPSKKPDEIEQNTAYIAIKNHFLKLFAPVTVPIHPVINLRHYDSAKQFQLITNQLPILFAASALADIFFQLTRSGSGGGGIPNPISQIPTQPLTFPDVQYNGETKISVSYQSFYEKAKN